MERAERTIGSCATEPWRHERISMSETTAQVAAEQPAPSHVGLTELLIFSDYLREIKRAIKQRDEIRKAALHRRRLTPLVFMIRAKTSLDN